jgi:hypothetical protein
MGGGIAAGLIGLLLGVVYSVILGVAVILIFDPVHGPPEGFTGINQTVHALAFAVVGIPAGAIGGIVTAVAFYRRGPHRASKSVVVTTIVILGIAFLVIGIGR